MFLTEIHDAKTITDSSSTVQQKCDNTAVTKQILTLVYSFI